MESESKPEPKPEPTPEPLSRLQARAYMAFHYPQTQDQLQKHVEKTLRFYKSTELPLSDEILWKWF
jgi:hypothetical protein